MFDVIVFIAALRGNVLFSSLITSVVVSFYSSVTRLCPSCSLLTPGDEVLMRHDVK